MKLKVVFIMCVAALSVAVLAPESARADRRAFAHTYEYMTMPKGDLELEFYNTQERATFDADSPRAFESQIEIEYGITQRWDISLYQVFQSATVPAAPEMSQGLNYAKTKVRTRYRFAERGVNPVDVLLYFELAKSHGVDAWAIEPKLIVARDFGKVTVAVNLIPELELEREIEASGDEEIHAEFEPGWALGATFESSPELKLGLEWFGAVHEPGEENVVETWIGPSVSWAPSSKVWVTTNAGFGLTDDSSDFVVRFIVGLGI